jgi:hypothetical protein
VPDQVRDVATPRNGALPPVVHLVLDEHIGIAGIPTDLPGGAELKRELSPSTKFGFASQSAKQYYGLESL